MTRHSVADVTPEHTHRGGRVERTRKWQMGWGRNGDESHGPAFVPTDSQRTVAADREVERIYNDESCTAMSRARGSCRVGTADEPRSRREQGTGMRKQECEWEREGRGECVSV